MMGYSKYIWTAGEVVTAAKLNHAEDGIFANANDIDELQTDVIYLTAQVGSPLVAATAAGMTDTSKIYVYTGSETGYTFGNWYYYDGSAWTSGGVYNSIAVSTDKTLTVEDKAADAKAAGDIIVVNGESVNSTRMNINTENATDVTLAEISDVNHVKDTVENYNSYDIWDGMLEHTDKTQSATTYTWSGDVCHVETPATGSTGASVCNIIASSDLPASVVPGGTYYLKYKTTSESVYLRFIFKTSDGTDITPYVRLNSDGDVTVPSNAAKWVVQFWVGSGVILNPAASVSDIHLLSGKTNAELSVPPPRYNVKSYGYDDMTHGELINLSFENNAFNIYYRETAVEGYSWLLIPVRKGDSVRLRTSAGPDRGRPYAIISQNYLILSKYTAGTSFDGTISIEQDGYLAVNMLESYRDSFICDVTWDITDTARSRNFINAIGTQTYEMLPEYDDDNVCRVIKTGPSLMGVIHHWAIVGASFDSGEINYTENGSMKEIEWYEYSCWEYLKRINGIPDMYIYADGGQNGLDWIRLGPDSIRGYAYASDTEVQNPYWSGRVGIGYGGGCWWKMKEDYINGDTKQAFVINLGSNDINNNYPRDSSWNVDPNYDPANPNGKYLCGGIQDIGTFTMTVEKDENDNDVYIDVDTLPTTDPSNPPSTTTCVIRGQNIYNSYAAYIGAILNRILYIQPDAIIFLCTIRNGFADNENRLRIWNQYNQVLKDIAAMDRYKDHVFIVDNGTYGPNYKVSPLRENILGYHPNAFGYQLIAGYWNTLLDYTIQKNNLKMTQSMFIGEEKQYVES